MSGTQFGSMDDYIVLEHIGEGSFGKVSTDFKIAAALDSLTCAIISLGIQGP